MISSVAFARAINLATPINLLTHYAKGTPSFYYFKTSTAYRVTNSSLFQRLLSVYNNYKPLIIISNYHNLPFIFIWRSLSTFPLQYFFTIAKFIILSLRGWFPYIPTSLLSSYLFIKNNYITGLNTFYGILKCGVFNILIFLFLF